MDRYEEALNRAKEWYQKSVELGDGAKDTREMFEEIFPELKESEDEKIRKKLIEYFTFAPTPKKYDYLAWLEKQKDIVAEYEDKLDRCACQYFDKGYKDALKKQKDRPTEMKSAEESLGISTKEYNKIVDECIYGEQKPAEWSEEDEKIIDLLTNFFFKENCLYRYFDVTPDAKYDIKYTPSSKIINWLESLKGKVAPQKQWNPSEMQMEALQACKELIDEESICGRTLVGLYNDLEKLKG